MTHTTNDVPENGRGAGTVLYCSCATSDLVSPETRSALEQALAAAGRRVVVVRDLCSLAACKDPLLGKLAGERRLQVVACYPRAVRWLFAAADVPLGEDVTILNQRTTTADELCQVLASDPAVSSRAEVVSLAAGDPASSWFPVIDRDRCTNCGQCASFCLFGVYHRDEASQVVVTHPANCKDNCPACARICPEVAIIFPKLEESPLNGDDVCQEGTAPTPIKVDIDAMMGQDVYQALAQRQQQHRRHLLRKSAVDKAMAERQRCSCQSQATQRLVTLVRGKRR